MSGPKSGPVVIVSEEEYQRRMSSRKRVYCQGFLAELEELRTVVAGARARHGERVTLLTEQVELPPEGSRVEAYVVAAERAQVLVRAASKRLREELAAVRAAQLEQELAASDGPTVGTVGTTPVAAPPPDLRPDVTRLLGRLDADADATTVDAARMLAQEVLAAPSAVRGTLLLDALRQRVLDANRVCAARREQAEELDELEHRTAALPGEQAAQARQELTSARQSGRADLAMLRRMVDAAEAAVDVEADRRYAAGAAAAALEELGYQVEEGFETLVARDGAAHLRRPEWSDHAVRLRIAPGSRELRVHVVRRDQGGADTSAEDTAVEASWCASLQDWLAGLERRGVRLDLHAWHAPGELPVLAVNEVNFPFTRGRDERRPTVRERHRDH